MGLLTLKLGGYLNLTGKKLPSQICKNVQSTNTNSRHDQTSLENTKTIFPRYGGSKRWKVA